MTASWRDQLMSLRYMRQMREQTWLVAFLQGESLSGKKRENMTRVIVSRFTLWHTSPAS